MIFFFIIIIDLLNLLFKLFDFFLTSRRHIFFFYKLSIILFLIQNIDFILQLFFLLRFLYLLFLLNLIMKFTFKRWLIGKSILINVISFNKIFQLSSTSNITYEMFLLIIIFIFLVFCNWDFSAFKLYVVIWFSRRRLFYQFIFQNDELRLMLCELFFFIFVLIQWFQKYLLFFFLYTEWIDLQRD